MSVEVHDRLTGRTITLDDAQRRLFLRELKRAKQHPPTEGVPDRVAPDCSITVTSGTGAAHYELYSRAVLVHPRTRRSWQFYFGLLLLEWLS